MTNKLILLLILESACIQAQTAAFPGAVATDANLKVAVNATQTTLSANINSSTLSIQVASCGLITANTLVTIDSEIISAASCGGNFITANAGGRGFDGSTAASHNSGATVSAFVDADRALDGDIAAVCGLIERREIPVLNG